MPRKKRSTKIKKSRQRISKTLVKRKTAGKKKAVKKTASAKKVARRTTLTKKTHVKARTKKQVKKSRPKELKAKKVSSAKKPRMRRARIKAEVKKRVKKSKVRRAKPKKRRKVVQATGVEALWRDYKTDGSEVLRDKLVLHYSPLVKYVAGRIASKLPPNVEAADLISYGMFGLIDAVEKFDLARGVKFETYAITRIRGAIIDELRKIDWVPRLVRFKAKRLEEAYLNLLNKYKRSPTDKELAQELSISVDELQDLMTQLSRTSQLTLEELWGKEGEEGEKIGLIDLLEDAETKDPSAVLEFEEVKKVIAKAVSELPQREKAIIALYYYRDLPLREIAEILNLTESRVSQLHMKALFYLKMRLKRRKQLLLVK